MKVFKTRVSISMYYENEEEMLLCYNIISDATNHTIIDYDEGCIRVLDLTEENSEIPFISNMLTAKLGEENIQYV